MAADASDDELVGRVGRGDKAAFGQLVARHQRRLMAVAMRSVGSRAGPAPAPGMAQPGMAQPGMAQPGMAQVQRRMPNLQPRSEPGRAAAGRGKAWLHLRSGRGPAGAMIGSR